MRFVSTPGAERQLIIGLDVEWRPQIDGTAPGNPASILQVVSRDTAVIFDLLQLLGAGGDEAGRAAAEALIEQLFRRDKTVLKVRPGITAGRGHRGQESHHCRTPVDQSTNPFTASRPWHCCCGTAFHRLSLPFTEHQYAPD